LKNTIFYSIINQADDKSNKNRGIMKTLPRKLPVWKGRRMKYMIMREQRTNNQQMIKEENIKQLFCLVAEKPGTTRAQLVRITSLSPTTVSSLVDELVQRELVLETGPANTHSAGRKPITLQINPDGRQLAVFSLSRWGVRFWLCNLALEELDSGYLEHSAERYGGFAEGSQETDPDAGADYMDFVETMLTHSPHYDPMRLLAVCISFPGIYLEQEEAFSWSAMHVSISAASVKQLEERLAVPVFLGNSSMCRAYAEKNCLDHPRGTVPDLIYFNVCDGLGAGIIADNVFLTGREHTAGEVGHVSVDYRGKRCVCGQRGCVEQYVNIEAVTERVRQKLEEQGSSDKINLEDIGKLCDAGDAVVLEIIDDVAAMLFTAIYSTVCITGIKRVVIGGGIEQLGDYFLNKLRAFSADHPHNKLARGLTISYAQSGLHGDSQGIAQFYLDHVFTITADAEEFLHKEAHHVATA
jgi:N-acetylglucosamine repressor